MSRRGWRSNDRLAELGWPRKEKWEEGEKESARASGRKGLRAENEEGREKRRKFFFFFQINFPNSFSS